MAPNVYALFVFFILFLLQLFVQSHATVEFIKSLEGSQKGEKVEGLHKLKIYLEHYGYLSNHYSKDDALHNSNDFDDVLESAIKSYQQYFNLKVTGTLNAETIALMAKPRCGVPDIMDRMNYMRSGRSTKEATSDGHQNILPHTVSHYNVVNTRYKWINTNIITYAFDPSTPAEATGPFDRAFKKWADATKRFRFKNSTSIISARVKISFLSGNHAVKRDRYDPPFDGLGGPGQIAHAFYPTDGRVHFDRDEKWSVKPTPDAYVYETVALHELGHTLGLNHSSVEASIMYAYMNHNEVKTLQKDDLDGIKDLYGKEIY